MNIFLANHHGRNNEGHTSGCYKAIYGLISCCVDTLITFIF